MLKTQANWGINLGKKIINDIVDKTDENIIEPIDYQQEAIKAQERQWAREDEIRAHVEAREDSAYQRAIEDARKAGINPNLVGITPAGSGAGITTATPLDYTMQSAEYDRETQQQLAEYDRETKRILQILEQEFKMEENEKDRLAKIIGQGLTAGAIVLR